MTEYSFRGPRVLEYLNSMTLEDESFIRFPRCPMGLVVMTFREAFLMNLRVRERVILIFIKQFLILWDRLIFNEDKY